MEHFDGGEYRSSDLSLLVRELDENTPQDIKPGMETDEAAESIQMSDDDDSSDSSAEIPGESQTEAIALGFGDASLAEEIASVAENSLLGHLERGEEHPDWFKESLLELPSVNDVIRKNEEQLIRSSSGESSGEDETVDVGDHAALEIVLEEDSIVRDDENALIEDASSDDNISGSDDLSIEHFESSKPEEETDAWKIDESDAPPDWFSDSQKVTDIQHLLTNSEVKDEEDTAVEDERGDNILNSLVGNVFAKGFTLLVPTEGMSVLPQSTRSGDVSSIVPVTDLEYARDVEDVDEHSEEGDELQKEVDMESDDEYDAEGQGDIMQPISAAVARSLNLLMPAVDMSAFLGTGTSGKPKTVDLFGLGGGIIKASTPDVKKYHTAAVWTCRMEDKSELFSLSRDGTAKRWDIRKKRHLTSYNGHDLTVYDYVITGNSLITCSEDCTLIEFDLKSGKMKRRLIGHENPVTALVISGKYVVSGCNDGFCIVWDINSGRKVHRLREAETGINCMEQIRGEVYCGCSDGVIRVWEPRMGDLLFKFEGHESYVMHFAKDRRYLYSASADKTIRSWDSITKRACRVFVGHGDWVNCLLLHDFTLFSGSRDTTVRSWDPNTGVCQQVFKGHTNSVRAIAVRGKLLFSGGKDKQVRAWDLDSGKSKWVSDGHDDWINAMVAVGDKLVTASQDNSLMVWNTKNGALSDILANRKMRFGKLINPKILGFIGVLSVIIDAFQLCGVALSHEMAWTTTGTFLRYVYPVIEMLQFSSGFTFVGGVIPRVFFYVSCTLISLFLLLFLASKKLSHLKYYKYFSFIWMANVGYCWLLSTICFIPFTKQLLQTLKCEALEADAHHELITSLVCFGPEHLAYTTVAMLLLVFYLILCIRFSNVDGNLTRIAYHWWFTRRFDQPVLSKVNIVSRYSLILDNIFLVLKIVLIATTTLLYRVPVVAAGALSLIFFLFWTGCVLFPNYYSSAMNSLRFALFSVVLWTSLVSFTSLIIEITYPEMATMDYIYLPVFLVGAAIILPLAFVLYFVYIVVRRALARKFFATTANIVAEVEDFFGGVEEDGDVGEIIDDTQQVEEILTASYEDFAVDTIEAETTSGDFEVVLPSHAPQTLRYCPYFLMYPDSLPRCLEPSLYFKYKEKLELSSECLSFKLTLGVDDEATLRANDFVKEFLYGFYYEVELVFPENELLVEVGFSSYDSMDRCLEYWGVASTGETKTVNHSIPDVSFSSGDVVGVGWNGRSGGQLYFTRNGEMFPSELDGVPHHLYPTITISGRGDVLQSEQSLTFEASGRVNFGQYRFLHSGYGENLKSPDEEEDVMVEEDEGDNLVNEMSESHSFEEHPKEE